MKRRFRSLYQSSGTALYGVEPERCVGRSVRRLPPSPSSALAGQPADERVRPVWRRSVASELAPNRNTTLPSYTQAANAAATTKTTGTPTTR